MINYINTDITTIQSGVIAHGCNTQGVMGAGVAKFLRNKHPTIYLRYREICQEAKDNGKEDDLLGDVNFTIINPRLVVANCFTQHLGKLINGRIADPEAIYSSVAVALCMADMLELPFYMPKIGGGLGGLDWDTDVEPIINKLVTIYDEFPIYVCVWP